MNKCIAVSMLLVVSLSGCPRATSPLVGTWAITFSGLDRGLVIMPDGEATSFLLDSRLAGTLKWRVDGRQFVLDQNTGGASIIYVGGIFNDSNSMTGAYVTWSGGGQGTGGTWTAARQ